MLIKLRMSETMTLTREDGFIRLPEECRKHYDLNIGNFVHVRTKKGGSKNFKIWQAFSVDVDKDPYVGYVSRDIYNMLAPYAFSVFDVNLNEEVTLGCDPEFFLIETTTDRPYPASYVFKHKNGDVGYDGVMAEIRPAPSLYENEVCQNMWKLIQKARKILNECHRYPETIRMVAASFITFNGFDGMAAGFHLHYGLPKALLGNVGVKNPRYELAQQIVKVLDYYVGKVGVLIEDNNECLRRSTPLIPYGKPGSFRMDTRTLEYRVPGGAALKHPILSEGLLGLGALVVDDLMIKIGQYTDYFKNIHKVKHFDIRECYPSIPRDPREIFEIICSPCSGRAKAHLDIIVNEITTMAGFEKRKPSIERLMKYIYSNKPFGRNIETNWSGHYERKSPEMELFH